MYNMSANNTKNTKSTTIRIDKDTKDKIENLDFVKKDTFDSIILKLVDFYEKNKKRSQRGVKNEK